MLLHLHHVGEGGSAETPLQKEDRDHRCPDPHEHGPHHHDGGVVAEDAGFEHRPGVVVFGRVGAVDCGKENGVSLRWIGDEDVESDVNETKYFKQTVKCRKL